ncbi:MAG: Fic family protein [Candidatus Omnitrophota bacterium]
MVVNDKEKLVRILRQNGMSKSELARTLEVSYKTVYRWMKKNIQPHPAQSHAINTLFKEYVDLREFVIKLRENLKNPIGILNNEPSIREHFLLETVYNSNTIAGSRLTRKDTESAFKNEKVRGKELFEVLEAVNHKNALMYMLEEIKPDFKITEDYILKLHSLIMYNFHDKHPGRYRNGVINVTLKMKHFVAKVNSFGKDVIGKAANDHYEFKSIHPFYDGNSRVGRIILITQLLSKEYPPAIIQSDDIYRYHMAMGKGDMGEFRDMIQIICNSIIEGYNLIKWEN